MAVTTGNDYDHIDIAHGDNATRHFLKDSKAREDLVVQQAAQPSSDVNKIWFPSTIVDEVAVPTEAEHEALEQEVNSLKSAIDINGLAEEITFEDGKRVNMSGTSIAVGSNSLWRYAKAACVAGDGFMITADSGTGSTYKAWCFTDADGVILKKSTGGTLVKDITYAPTGAAYIYINDQKTGGHCYAGIPLDMVFAPKQQGSTNYALPMTVGADGNMAPKKALHVTKDTTSIVVTVGRVVYTIIKHVNAEHNVTVWRMNACSVINNDGTQTVVWASIDSDGVLRLSGEGDYIGGYHGNEQMQSINIFVDGATVAESAEINTDADTVTICETSILYHYTEQYDGSAIFNRNKILMINKDGLTVKNLFTALGAVTVNLAYLGMLSVNRYADAQNTIQFITGYDQNATYAYCAHNEAFEANTALTAATIHTTAGDFSIECHDMAPANKIKGSITSYTGASERLKTYLGLRDVTLAENDVIRGETVISYRM